MNKAVRKEDCDWVSPPCSNVMTIQIGTGGFKSKAATLGRHGRFVSVENTFLAISVITACNLWRSRLYSDKIYPGVPLVT